MFRRFFERIFEEYFEAGLMGGAELFFDSTEVKANAAVDGLCTLHSGEPFEGTLRGARRPKEDRGLRRAAPDSLCVGHRCALPTVGDDALTNNARKSKDCSEAHAGVAFEWTDDKQT